MKIQVEFTIRGEQEKHILVAFGAQDDELNAEGRMLMCRRFIKMAVENALDTVKEEYEERFPQDQSDEPPA